MIVAKRVSFDAAHYLPNYEGKCINMHGHRWVVEVAVEGEVGDDGMVIDFAVLGDILREIKDLLDHQLVNNVIPNPTAENIAMYIKTWAHRSLNVYLDKQFGRFGHKRGIQIKLVRVWETEDSYAELSTST